MLNEKGKQDNSQPVIGEEQPDCQIAGCNRNIGINSKKGWLIPEAILKQWFVYQYAKG